MNFFKSFIRLFVRPEINIPINVYLNKSNFFSGRRLRHMLPHPMASGPGQNGNGTSGQPPHQEGAVHQYT